MSNQNENYVFSLTRLGIEPNSQL